MKKRKPRAERPPGGNEHGACMWPAKLFNSEAYRALSTGTELKLLHGFYRRRGYSKKEKKRARTRLMPIGGADIYYPLEAMHWETDACLAQCIEARDTLHRLGFIDWIHASDGMGGRPNVYRLSERYLKWHPEPGRRKGNGFADHPLPKKPKRRGRGRTVELQEKSGSNGQAKKSPTLENRKPNSGKPELKVVGAE